MRGLLATIASLVLLGAVLAAFAGSDPVGLAVGLIVAIGVMAMATLLLWIGQRSDEPEARIARRVEWNEARRIRLGRALEATELIDAKESGTPIIDARSERTIKVLIELIRLGDRPLAKDAVEELGVIGPEALHWIKSALPQLGRDAQVDLRLALQAIAAQALEEDALPVARVFE